jgi:hypothetical protein
MTMLTAVLQRAGAELCNVTREIDRDTWYIHNEDVIGSYNLSSKFRNEAKPAEEPKGIYTELGLR